MTAKTRVVNANNGYRLSFTPNTEIEACVDFNKVLCLLFIIFSIIYNLLISINGHDFFTQFNVFYLVKIKLLKLTKWWCFDYDSIFSVMKEPFLPLSS